MDKYTHTLICMFCGEEGNVVTEIVRSPSIQVTERVFRCASCGHCEVTKKEITFGRFC
jgi:uncharacterized Zn finger protein